MKRLTIATALQFDSSDPEYLVIEYGDDSIGRVVGQYFSLEDAFKGAHARHTTGDIELPPRRVITS